MKAKYKRIKRNEIINTTKPQNIKVFNYGLAILKAIYAFLVVRHHSFDLKQQKIKLYFILQKKDCYMFLHFLFCHFILRVKVYYH